MLRRTAETVEHEIEPLTNGPADLLLTNAQVLTLEPKQPRAQAVAIRGDTIVAVGSQGDVTSLAGPATRTIDCQEMALLPGFVDAHCHLFATAAAMQGVDCGPPRASSLALIQEALHRRAEATAPGRWVRGFGYDDLALAELRHPTRWELDLVAPQHPVRLDHRSGHASVLNSLGLEAAGIHRDTPDPPEGVIVRAEADGEPTGLLLEMGGFLRERLGHLREAANRQEGIDRLNQRLLGYGITSVQDAGPDNGMERWEAFGGLQESGQLQCRVTMLAGLGRLEEFSAKGWQWGEGDGWLRLGHAKTVLTLTTGTLHPDPELLAHSIDQAHQSGFPIAIHAVEQEAVAAAAQALAESKFSLSMIRAGREDSRLKDECIADPTIRDRIEHCAECPPQLVDQVRRGRAMVVSQPGFIYWNGDRYRERVEPKVLDHLYPVGALARAGVPVAFGSDAPVIDANPWPGICSAVTGATRSGGGLGRGGPTDNQAEQKVSIVSALRMYTIAGAYAEGTQHIKGTIRRGKLADLVLVDQDPTRVPPASLQDIRPVLTVLGGKVVWEVG